MTSFLLTTRPADPEVWFAQVKAQFTTKDVIVQKTCSDYVISSLSPAFAMEVWDLLLKPPVKSPYDTVKVELIKVPDIWTLVGNIIH